MKWLHVSAFSFCAAAMLFQSNSALAAGNCAAPMPAGFDWPADSTRLYQISGGLSTSGQTIPGKIDTKAQRDHGWSLFAAITQPSGPQPGAPPVFHTWYSVEETFDPTDGKVDCASRRVLLRLSLPTQLLMEHNALLRSDLRKEGINVSPRFDVNPALVSVPQNYSALDTAGSNSVLAFSHVAFNQEMYDYIRDNKYYKRSTLNQLIDSSTALKPIVDPPLKGISLKFSWWPIAPTGLTPVPVWDFNQRFPGDAKNPPDTWPRVVVVDPIGGQAAPTSVTLNGYAHSNPSVVSLDKFYAVKVSAEEAALANADFRIAAATKEVLGRPLQAGDYLVMTAMHIATREFDPWVFTTFWWSDAPDAGNLAADRPATVASVWRNYVMEVSYNINNPKTDQGQPPVAYNPWLELFQLGGTRSQCMACHARAAFGTGVVASFNPASMATSDPNGFNASPNGANDPNFQPGTLSLHRIWTIFTRAQ